MILAEPRNSGCNCLLGGTRRNFNLVGLASPSMSSRPSMLPLQQALSGWRAAVRLWVWSSSSPRQQEDDDCSVSEQQPFGPQDEGVNCTRPNVVTRSDTLAAAYQIYDAGMHNVRTML